MYNEEWPFERKQKSKTRKHGFPYDAETVSVRMIISVGCPAIRCTLFPQEGTQKEQLYVQQQKEKGSMFIPSLCVINEVKCTVKGRTTP